MEDQSLNQITDNNQSQILSDWNKKLELDFQIMDTMLGSVLYSKDFQKILSLKYKVNQWFNIHKRNTDKKFKSFNLNNPITTQLQIWVNDWITEIDYRIQWIIIKSPHLIYFEELNDHIVLQSNNEFQENTINLTPKHIECETKSITKCQNPNNRLNKTEIISHQLNDLFIEDIHLLFQDTNVNNYKSNSYSISSLMNTTPHIDKKKSIPLTFPDFSLPNIWPNPKRRRNHTKTIHSSFCIIKSEMDPNREITQQQTSTPISSQNTSLAIMTSIQSNDLFIEDIHLLFPDISMNNKKLNSYTISPLMNLTPLISDTEEKINETQT